MKTVSFVLLMVAILVVPCGVSADGQDGEAGFGVMVSSAIGRSYDGWTFDYHGSVVNVSPSLYLGTGLNYGPISSFSSTQFVFSFRVATIESVTDETALEFLDGATGKFALRVTPIMAWVSIVTAAEFGPFVEAGLGGAFVEFAESYNPPELADAEFDYWGFSYGFSGGLQYRLSPRAIISGFGDIVLVTEHQERLMPSGRVTGLLGDAGVGGFGIRLNVRI